MSSIIHRLTTSDAKYPFYDLDDSDQRLIQASSKMEEEDICIPFPYGPDFLDVQVGEVLPPAEDESDWGVQYVACDENANKRVRILRKLGYGADASVWMGYEEPVGPNVSPYDPVLYTLRLKGRPGKRIRRRESLLTCRHGRTPLVRGSQRGPYERPTVCSKSTPWRISHCQTSLARHHEAVCAS